MAQKINHSFDMSPTKEQTRLPLVMNATSLPAFGSKPAELHSYKPDLDPTEWKPNSTSEGKPKFPVSAIPLSFIIPNLLPEGALDIDNDNEDEDEEESRNSETTVQTEETTRPEMSQRQSAAFSYLSQFHRSASSFLSLSSSRRPVMNSSASASSVSIPTIPDRTSNPGTPGMSLGRSSGSSANSSSSSSSIPLSIPGRQSTISSIASHGVNHNAEEFGKDARLAFNRQTLTTVEAVGMTIPGDAKGSLEGLLARAA